MAPAAADDYCFSPNGAGKTVCVMDASGRVGSALVHRLLQRGYTVHAAFHSSIKSVDEVRAELQKAQCCGNEISSNVMKKKIKMFKADPLDYHSVMDALKGCCGLFYSFKSPFGSDPYDEHMAEMEVRAAHNVLEACAQTETMFKVVFQSSATSVIWRERYKQPGEEDIEFEVDERNWSDINFCKKYKLWHALSKTSAEKTAWALAMDRGVEMVTVNAGLLLAEDNDGGCDDDVNDDECLSIKNPYLKGAAEMYENGVLVTVDLKYLIDAHVCVFEDVSSYGRYLCFNHVINCNEDIVKFAAMLLPTSSAPVSFVSSTKGDDARVYPQRISNNKLNKHMLNFDF